MMLEKNITLEEVNKSISLLKLYYKKLNKYYDIYKNTKTN